MSNLMRTAGLVGLALAVGIAAGCDKLGTTEDGSVNNKKEAGPGTPDLPPGAAEVVVLKNTGESAEADFAKASQYLVVPYSVSETAADAIEFTVTITPGAGASNIGEQSFPLRLTPRQRPPLDPIFAARWQRRLKAESWLRGLAEAAARQRHSLPGSMTHPLAGANCTASDKCDANEVCQNKVCASQLTIKTESFSITKTITATVKKKGTRAAVLVDSADTVTDAVVTALLERFEKIILPRNVALFGDPPLQGTSGPTASDRNADGLVWLVLTKKVQEKKAVGFFVATDFTDDAKSNKADILYVDAAVTSDSALPILAHELQHLLNYGTKVYKPTVGGGTGALEALWLDEGQAHFAEDACGFGGENTTLLRQKTLPDFSDKSLLSTQDDLSMRGMAFLFVRYLFEQKGAVSYEQDGSIKDTGGAAFLKAIHSSSKQGVGAVNEALAGTFSDWKAGFDSWMAAMSLDGRGFTQVPRYVYQPLQDDPKTNNQIGVKVRGARKDETGKAVNLEGPAETEITDVSKPTADKVPNASARFLLLKGQTGKVGVKVECSDKDFRFAVIRLGK